MTRPMPIRMPRFSRRRILTLSVSTLVASLASLSVARRTGEGTWMLRLDDT